MNASPAGVGARGATPRPGLARVNGLLVLCGIVLLGLGSGAAYYQYRRPKMAAERERWLAQAPSTPRGRLELWYRYGAPQIHHRLTQVARFSTAMPWLVTHAVASAEEGEPEIWGIDCTALTPELARLEGMTVVVELPRPRLLGRGRLAGDEARHVPVYAATQAVPDPSGRLKELALFFLEGLPRALERDIPGACLEIRVAAQ